MRLPSHAIPWTLLAVLGACGGEPAPAGGADAAPTDTPRPDAAPPAPPPALRVSIAPRAVLFTAPGQERQLSASAVDEAGRPVAGNVTWTTSAPAQITVTADGTLRSVAPIGSALIVAEIGGVRSPPLPAIAVETKPGTLLVTDAQVVEIGGVVLGAGPGPEAEYDVTLRGVAAPAVDTVVLASEEARVAGRVVSSRVDGDRVVVRLRATTLDDLLDRYALDFTWNVGDLEPGPEEDTGAGLAKPESPFKCSAGAAAKFSKNAIDIKLGRTGTFTYVNHKKDAGMPADFLQFRLVGELTLSGSIGLKAEAGFEGNAKCELKYPIPIPITGFLAFFIAPAIPIGIGASFNGKLVLASLELTMTGKLGAKYDLGLTCAGTAPCATIQVVEPVNDVKPKVEVPSANDMRVELGGALYLISGLDIAFLGGAKSFGVAELKIALTQSSNLAFVLTQGDKRDYASRYELKLGYTLGLGGGVKDLVSFLGKGLVSVDAEVADGIVLAKTATGTFSVDKPRIAANQNAMFATTLRDTEYGLLGYNVDSVELYRKKKGSDDYEHKASIRASPGQTRFDWLFRPTEADYGEQEFFAFVKTKFPVIELEAADDSGVPIEVLAFCAAGPLAKPRPASTCGGTLRYDTTSIIPYIGTTSESITAQVRLVKDEATTSPYTVGFRPAGTFTYERSGTLANCTIRIEPTTGTLVEAPYSGGLLLYTETEPYRYDGAMSTGEFTVTQVVTCPDVPPQITVIPSWNIPLFMVALDEGFDAGPDGKTLRGTRDSASETLIEHWEWDLTID